MTYIPDSEHFKSFAGQLEKLIATYGTIANIDWNAHQKKQVEQLLTLEKRWRDALIRHRFGPWCYKKFIAFIQGEKRNILAARPYFRERQDVFAKHISKALKKGDGGSVDLYRFAINYQFIMFVMKLRTWPKKSPVTVLAEQIGQLRKDIVSLNLPLGIARARVFYSRTPKSHLSYMDEIQIAAEGMMAGIDKYSPERKGIVNTRTFRGTMIGRMVGNFIEAYSETLVHFYPVDKRKIYRANKLVRNFAAGVDYEKLAEGVNAVATKDSASAEDGGVIESHKTTGSEIADLLAAASTVSADSSLPTDPEAPEPITRFAAPEATRPDVQVEDRDAMSLMAKVEESLSVFEKKLLRLMGLRLNDVGG